MKLVLPDALPDSAKVIFQSYHRWITPGGVCVNVALGASDWDLRPLVLEQGNVWLYRFSPPLDSATRSFLLAECEGFTLVPSWNVRFRSEPEGERILMVRPFVPATLGEAMIKGELPIGEARMEVGRQIIAQVGTLMRRNLVHGHISLSNIALMEGRILFLDPRFGALQRVRDPFVAPEVTDAKEIPVSADLFSLGKVLQSLLGAEMSDAQREITSQLLLQSPRHRPSFSSVEEAFATLPNDRIRASEQVPSQVHGGRKLVQGIESQPVKIEDGHSQSAGASSGANSPRKPGGRLSPALKKTLGVGAALATILGIVRYKAPRSYYDLAHYIQFLAPQSSTAYEAAWESGDRSRMKQVARAATLNHEPAADAAIVDSIMSGAKPQFTVDGKTHTIHGTVMRVSFNDLWGEELSSIDRRAVINLTVAQLAPEGLDEIPPLRTLHPAVILAVASQLDPRAVSPQLRGIPVEMLGGLAEPIGSLFRGLVTLGIKDLSDSRAVGLAAIATGNPSANAVDAYLAPLQVSRTDARASGDSNDSTKDGSAKNSSVAADQIKDTLDRVALLVPIATANTDLASKIVASIRDQGGPLGQALSWFDIEDLAGWSAIPSVEKLRLLLNQPPGQALSTQQYADLLLFPLAGIRAYAATKLKEDALKAEGEPLLALLSSEQNRLTRPQGIALAAALQLKPAARAPFLSSWFTNTKPDPFMVLQLLLARVGSDNSDLFNLDAARYLKRTEWPAPLELLRLLAAHPEPLARSLAYARLNPTDAAQAAVLKERLGVESDGNLKKSIMLRLGGRREGAGSPSEPTSGSVSNGVSNPADRGSAHALEQWDD